MTKRAKRGPVGLVLAATVVPATAQITVHEPGFVVDTLVSGQIDGLSPRIEAVRNPAYGSGVVAASISNGVLTVRRITDGNIEVVGTFNTGPNTFVLDLRFDSTGLFGNRLVVSYQTTATKIATLLVVEPDGSISVLADSASFNDDLAFNLDFVGPGAGYTPGAYLFDLDGGNGSSIFHLAPPATLTKLAQDSLPAGRGDVDVRGAEFDQSGAFGSRFIVAENDDNQSGTGGVFAVSPTLTWTTILPVPDTQSRHHRDIVLASGGLLGSFAYASEAIHDVIERIEPSGAVTTFASGLDVETGYDNQPGGASGSISVDASGDVLYISDDAGIFRIRPTGDEPGPTIIAREPSSPSGTFCDENGIPFVRLVWSEPVAFAAADVSVLDAGAAPVTSAVSGSGTQFMLISFAAPLIGDTYTITIADTAVASDNNAPIDGDNDGIAGGAAVVMLTHRCAADLAQPYGLLDLSDVNTFVQGFLNGCP